MEFTQKDTSRILRVARRRGLTAAVEFAERMFPGELTREEWRAEIRRVLFAVSIIDCLVPMAAWNEAEIQLGFAPNWLERKESRR